MSWILPKASILEIIKLLNWKQFPKTHVKHTSTSNSLRFWRNHHLLVKFCNFFFFFWSGFKALQDYLKSGIYLCQPFMVALWNFFQSSFSIFFTSTICHSFMFYKSKYIAFFAYMKYFLNKFVESQVWF